MGNVVYSDTMTLAQVIKLLNKECEKAGGQREWARANDIDHAWVSRLLGGGREPGDKVLAALKLRRLPTTYERIMDERKAKKK
jgi:hypothetical protein